MQTKTNLKIDWATHEAAKYACENWHYSKCIPVNKLVKIGAWENNKFIGVVIFSPGASAYSGRRYGLSKQQICELTRVALSCHKNPVSKILSISMKFLKLKNPGLRMIVSYADPRQNHHGGIYQAGNWIYSGVTEPGGDFEYLIDGKWTHPRSVKEKFGFKGKALIEKGVKVRKPTDKHRYLMPLDDEMRKKIEPLRKPYPKRAKSKDNVASGFQSEEGGAIPTLALQQNEESVING